METKLVAGRECNGCTVCCVSLTIDDPQLRKPQGYRCSHLSRAGGCGIYETRPVTCRTFYCGWRMLKWVNSNLRPDTSGVLIRLHEEKSREQGTNTLGIAVSLLTPASVNAEGLAETVAAAVAAGRPVYLNVPGPPGYTSASAKMNEALEEAVAFKDKAAILATLRRLRAAGKTGPRVVITFDDAAESQPDQG